VVSQFNTKMLSLERFIREDEHSWKAQNYCDSRH